MFQQQIEPTEIERLQKELEEAKNYIEGLKTLLRKNKIDPNGFSQHEQVLPYNRFEAKIH